MGFSVSASTAIIFISFLMAAATLYDAWDNSYSNVQAAREDWYELRLSRLSTSVGLNEGGWAYVVNQTSGVYNVTFYIQNFGNTLYIPHWSGIYDGDYITLYDATDDNVGWVSDYTYLLPGEVAEITITDIPLNGTQHTLKLVFGNGCWLMLSWHDNGTDVLLDFESSGCPMEVS